MPPPPSCRSIGLKWIYKIKKNAKGETIRSKARLVVKEYSQRYGLDYDEVFAHVARFELVRVFVALATRAN